MHGQTTLEYLVLLAAVLVIASVIIFMITSTSAGATKQQLLARCKQAATQCNATHVVFPDDPCSFCEEACTDPQTGYEIVSGAIENCKSGNPSAIG